MVSHIMHGQIGAEQPGFRSIPQQENESVLLRIEVSVCIFQIGSDTPDWVSGDRENVNPCIMGHGFFLDGCSQFPFGLGEPASASVF